MATHDRSLGLAAASRGFEVIGVEDRLGIGRRGAVQGLPALFRATFACAGAAGWYRGRRE